MTRRDGTDYAKVMSAATAILKVCSERGYAKQTAMAKVILNTGFPHEIVYEAFSHCVRQRYLVPIRGDKEIYWEAT